VVVDCIMPDIHGLELCERIVNNPATSAIPLIVLTGDEPSYTRALTMHRVDAVLMKPCPADVLLRAIVRAISVRAIR
jgi:CheY-like chemotaxis protein